MPPLGFSLLLCMSKFARVPGTVLSLSPSLHDCLRQQTSASMPVCSGCVGNGVPATVYSGELRQVPRPQTMPVKLPTPQTK